MGSTESSMPELNLRINPRFPDLEPHPDTPEYAHPNIQNHLVGTCLHNATAPSFRRAFYWPREEMKRTRATMPVSIVQP
jgi:hypothetical protein